jgi:LDH2 family malate/lactate/ureidoglycolate dehydrogenase
MGEPSNYLDPNRPDAVRLSVVEARALGEGALAGIGYGEDDARIVVDQLIDNSLCGYRFAGLPRILAIAREAKTQKARVPVAVVHETPVSALVDGGNNVGYIAVYRVLRDLPSNLSNLVRGDCRRCGRSTGEIIVE